jgi:glycosyltransferase involved in cell wall biosynthesis
MPLAEQRGGAERMLLDLARHVDADVLRLVVVLLENGPMERELESLGVTVHVVPAGRLRQLSRLVRTTGRIASIAHQERAGIIVGWMAKGHVYGSLAATRARLPAALYQLGTPTVMSPLDRIATALPSDVILVCSLASAQAQNSIRPRREVRVVYPGVDLERFDPAALPSPSDARRQLGLPARGPIIGMAGRLQRWKGMHLLVEAMPRVRASFPDARCVLIGGSHDLEPEYPSFLRGLISELELDHHVLLAGQRADVPLWLQAADIVIHASDREPFGIVVIEAMALGKPVVAADSGGPREILSHEIEGLLAPSGDAAALARAIGRYLEDEGLAKRLGAAARRRALAFSSARYADQLTRLFRELALGPARSST